MSDNVVFLKFRNDQPVESDGHSILACLNCKNKTYLAKYDSCDSYPKLVCACCGSEGGRFGWVHGDG